MRTQYNIGNGLTCIFLVATTAMQWARRGIGAISNWSGSRAPAKHSNRKTKQKVDIYYTETLRKRH